METLRKELDAAKRYESGINEGGDGNTPRQDFIEREMDSLARKMQAEKDAAWTPELTASRRAAWNESVRTMGTCTAQKVHDIEVRLGFTNWDLVKAVKRFSA